MPDPLQDGLLGLDYQELSGIAQKFGQPEFRARQLFDALYPQRLTALDSVTTLPKPFRAALQQEGLDIKHPRVEKSFQSTDGTIRYLISMADGETVETVWMPEGDDGETGDGTEAGDSEWHRATICVSSQVDMERQRVNIVFMGMGEPFLNYPNFIKAVRLLVEGVGFPESRMTVSTSGILPRIHDFGAEAVRPKLAISLNASNDQVRSSIMPINKKWNLEMLMQAARDFPLRNRERITFEYVLLSGVNESPAHAREVIELLRGIRCKVNLIALNPGPGIQFGTPSEQSVQVFKDLLVKAGVPAFVRRPRGRDIYAACGQLKRTVA